MATKQIADEKSCSSDKNKNKKFQCHLCSKELVGEYGLWRHYRKIGKQGLTVEALMHNAFYLEHNPDIKSEKIPGLLKYFCIHPNCPDSKGRVIETGYRPGFLPRFIGFERKDHINQHLKKSPNCPYGRPKDEDWIKREVKKHLVNGSACGILTMKGSRFYLDGAHIANVL